VITIRRVGLEDLREVVGAIDRSEHVDGEYAVVEGRLVERPVTMSDIPPLDPVGDRFHSVAAKVQFCASVVDEHAGVVLGAFNGERVAGVAVVAPSFEPPLAWFVYLNVNRADRRHGVASALWDAASLLARESGARQLYVSATPTASTVGFYLSRGCRLADPVHPVLFEHEPDDIHLVGELGQPPVQIDGAACGSGAPDCADGSEPHPDSAAWT
jgi:GNAT superfamily N-acetyltransferase